MFEIKQKELFFFLISLTLFFNWLLEVVYRTAIQLYTQAPKFTIFFKLFFYVMASGDLYSSIYITIYSPN